MGHRGPAMLVAATTVLTVVAMIGGARPASAASTTVDLDQWASSDRAWQNGNLNGNNSRYPEGGVVPFRLAMEGLKPGVHTIHIDYDFTAGGHKAYDFLATWNVTNAKGKICAASGGAISSMCPNMPTPSSFAFPSDGYVANGLSVRGAERYSGAPRRLTIWGGTVLSIGRQAHSGSVNGNSTADVLIKFRATGKAVLLAWGGHLAQSAYWDKAGGGAPDGAALVSGAPWHMRTLQLDGSGNKNQDRSIQPSAIVGILPPQALAPSPSPTPTPRPAVPTATPRSGGGTPRPGGGPAAPGVTPFPHLTPPATTTGGRDVISGDTDLRGVLLWLVVTLLVALALATTARPGRRRHR